MNDERIKEIAEEWESTYDDEKDELSHIIAYAIKQAIKEERDRIADEVEHLYDHMSVGMNTSVGLVPSHAVRDIHKAIAQQLRHE